MTWNYRVIEHDYEDGKVYQIHEVYYDEQGTAHSWTLLGMSAQGETLNELIDDMLAMMGALAKPLLRIENDKLVEVG